MISAGRAVTFQDISDRFAHEQSSTLFKNRVSSPTVTLAKVHIVYEGSRLDRCPEIRALGRYLRWFGQVYAGAGYPVLVNDANMVPHDPS